MGGRTLLGQLGLLAELVVTASGLHRLVFNKYYIDELYEALVVRPIHGFSVFLWKIVDVIFVDKILVLGPAKVLRGFGGLGRMLQSGNVQTYAFWIFVGFAALDNLGFPLTSDLYAV